MTSDPTGLHKGVGTGQAGSSQGPAPRALGGKRVMRGPRWGVHLLFSHQGSVPDSRQRPRGQLSLGAVGTPLSGRHMRLLPSLLSAVPASCQPGSQLGTLVPGGPQSPCPLPGSASQPPPPPSRPSNGWVMSAGGVGGRGRDAGATGAGTRAANQVCQRHLSPREHLGLKVTLSPSVTIMSLASVLKPASRPGRGGVGWARGCAESPVPRVLFPGVS